MESGDGQDQHLALPDGAASRPRTRGGRSGAHGAHHRHRGVRDRPIRDRPVQGWWILVLLAATAVTLGTLEARLRRSEHPELVVVQGMLIILALLAVGAAFSGGEDSPALPWLVLPVAIAAARFRPQVLVVGAAITAAVMFRVSVGVDAQAVVDDPTRLISALTLLVGITAISSALTEGELEHRDLAVLDSSPACSTAPRSSRGRWR